MKKQQEIETNKDIFGMAIKAFYEDDDETDITVHSPDFDDDQIPVSYLFREFKDMPALERKALQLAKGRVLDVGSGAGSHALYLQEEKNLEVTAIDISKGAAEICKKRGLRDVRNINFFDLQNEKFDTLLFLMNGTGIVGKLKNLDQFFDHAGSLLNRDGQIIMDSSDLSYLFDADEDGGIWINPDEPYYGEMQFSLSYKDQTSESFPWLYLDYNKLELAASIKNFSCELVKKGKHYDFLALLKPKNEKV